MTKYSFNLQPTLENHLLIIRPLKKEDFENLYKIASDPLIWEQHPEKNRYQKPVFELFFKEAMLSLGAFVIIDKATGQIIGSTRFQPVKETQNAIEIGWSFLARNYWGGLFNKSVKNLMMEYAFNFVDNVLYYINENNMRSRKAVEKLGGELVIELEGQTLDRRKISSVIYNINKKKWQLRSET